MRFFDMKKHYCIVFAICMLGLILLLLEDKFVYQYTPLAEFVVKENGVGEPLSERMEIAKNVTS